MTVSLLSVFLGYSIPGIHCGCTVVGHSFADDVLISNEMTNSKVVSGFL